MRALAASLREVRAGDTLRSSYGAGLLTRALQQAKPDRPQAAKWAPLLREAQDRLRDFLQGGIYFDAVSRGALSLQRRWGRTAHR